MAWASRVTATRVFDTRHDHGELRVVTLGHIGDQPHVVTRTQSGTKVRNIALSKAIARERKACRKRARDPAR